MVAIGRAIQFVCTVLISCILFAYFNCYLFLTECHSLARWYASYLRDYAKSEVVFHQNCFQRQFSESCTGYAFYKLFGAPGIKRNFKQAFEALKFGCNTGKSSQCCQVGIF